MQNPYGGGGNPYGGGGNQNPPMNPYLQAQNQQNQNMNQNQMNQQNQMQNTNMSMNQNQGQQIQNQGNQQNLNQNSNNMNNTNPFAQQKMEAQKTMGGNQNLQMSPNGQNVQMGNQQGMNNNNMNQNSNTMGMSMNMNQQGSMNSMSNQGMNNMSNQGMNNMMQNQMNQNQGGNMMMNQNNMMNNMNNNMMSNNSNTMNMTNNNMTQQNQFQNQNMNMNNMGGMNTMNQNNGNMNNMSMNNNMQQQQGQVSFSSNSNLNMVGGGNMATGMSNSNNQFQNNNMMNRGPNTNSMGGLNGPGSVTNNNNNNNMNRTGPIMRNQNTSFTPIRDLSCYSAKFSIKARITSKGDIRTYKNQKGDGRLFNIELLDEEGGEIKCTFFNELVDKFYNTIEEGNVYIFSKGKIQNANPRYNKKGTHEITFGKETTIEPATDEGNIQAKRYDFVPIKQILNKNQGEEVDLCCVIQLVEPTKTINLKSGEQKDKRDILVVDNSQATIAITMWGDACNKYELNQSEVAFIKNLRVGEFGGRSLSFGGSSSIDLNPDDPRAFELAEWYTNLGSEPSTIINSISFEKLTTVGIGLGVPGGSGGGSGLNRDKISTLQDVINDGNSLGMPDPSGGGAVRDAGWHTIKPVTIQMIHHENRMPYYLSCPQMVEKLDYKTKESKMMPCGKKLDQHGMSGNFCCADGHQTPTPTPKFTLGISVCDHTRSETLSAFSDAGEHILQSSFDPNQPVFVNGLGDVDFSRVTANDLHNHWLQKDQSQESMEWIETLFRQPNFSKWEMRVMVKKKIWNDEERLEITIQGSSRLGSTDDGMKFLQKELGEEMMRYEKRLGMGI